MKKLLAFLFPALLLFSCKAPLPVYFDTPIGQKLQGFDTLLAGNYIPLDDVIDKGTKELREKYIFKYDRIILKDTSVFSQIDAPSLADAEIKNMLGINNNSTKLNSSEKNCDSIFKAFANFSQFVSAALWFSIDEQKHKNAKTGIIKITYDRILYILADSAGNNTRDTLLTLSPSALLTFYAGKYYLNFKTPHGYEIMQLEIWEGKILSVRPFYFTNYDDCASTVSALNASVKNIYPGMIPVFDREKKIIGYKAAMNSKLVSEKFKKSEQAFLYLKMR